MSMRRFKQLLAAIAAPLMLAAAGSVMAGQPPVPLKLDGMNDADKQLILRGQYLATASDCIACHTVHHGKAMAGGLVMSSPVGDIVSTNITPSKTTGIGNYTEQQFSDAVRKGVRADGARLYPAMPYPSYALMTDEDIHAMYVYFMKGVEPVEKQTAETKLPFPMNMRFLMTGWNLMFLPSKPLADDPGQSAEWNRGRYLTQGAAHCSTCHTPRGVAMQELGDRDLSGAQVGAWYAPNITSDKVYGIGSWSREELVTYLKTGRVEGKAQAAGSMAEAISFSFSHLTDADLNAIATYVMSVKPVADAKAAPSGKSRFEQGKAGNDLSGFRGEGYVMGVKGGSAGAQLFSANCASCHGFNAQGTKDGYYPSLFSNAATAGPSTSNLVATILYGVDRKTAAGHVFMPPFGGQPNAMVALNNEEIAQLANYVFTNHGEPTLQVTAADVQVIRDGGPRSNIITLARIGMGVGAVVVLLLLLALIVRSKRRNRGVVARKR
ncbi:cytochrome c [Pigmentiphaga aceris]|uniref:Cytochrome c n=1 Tax=Pigmentiphaga aceris TaxID=1940612 RepID=A0A5C0AXI6_9BURK|nr:cytochrome c [Pigmentiphaga aceris]QEI07159.1 cytochrome c [Pigmentiphaga aceris]